MIIMNPSKKSIVIFSLLAFTIIGIAAIKPPEEEHKNLKVLPKNISHEALDKIMDEFKDALGVKCNYCHVHAKDDPQKWDYASDEKPEKSIARKMITMSNRINKKFFHGKSKYGDVNAVLEIRCVTCHHGTAHPGIPEEEEKPKQ